MVDLVRALVPGIGGVPEQGLDGLDFGENLGADVLDGLEGADDALELLALLRVVDRDVESLLGGAEGVGGDGDLGRVDGALRALGTAAEAFRGVQVDAGEGDFGDPPGVVDGLEGLDVYSRGRRLEQVEAAPGFEQEGV